MALKLKSVFLLLNIFILLFAITQTIFVDVGDSLPDLDAEEAKLNQAEISRAAEILNETSLNENGSSLGNDFTSEDKSNDESSNALESTSETTLDDFSDESGSLSADSRINVVKEESVLAESTTINSLLSNNEQQISKFDESTFQNNNQSEESVSMLSNETIKKNEQEAISIGKEEIIQETDISDAETTQTSGNIILTTTTISVNEIVTNDQNQTQAIKESVETEQSSTHHTTIEILNKAEAISDQTTFEVTTRIDESTTTEHSTTSSTTTESTTTEESTTESTTTEESTTESTTTEESTTESTTTEESTTESTTTEESTTESTTTEESTTESTTTEESTTESTTTEESTTENTTTSTTTEESTSGSTTASKDLNDQLPRKNVWIKPEPFQENVIEEKTKIKADCPDLNCEFGYKTDLYGNTLCSCFNPCLENKCGSNKICKIAKGEDGKFRGLCYDPTQIERPIKCHLPLKPGYCKDPAQRDYSSRFYFDPFHQTCKHFIYTGCGGNENNFETWEKCQMECNTCTMPPVKGPCRASLIRYYYDQTNQTCVPFSFGGCRGNENNFSSKQLCIDSCVTRKAGALFLHGMPIDKIKSYYRNGGSKQKKQKTTTTTNQVENFTKATFSSE